MNPESKLPNGVRIAIAMGTLFSVLLAFNQCTPEPKKNSRKSKSPISAPTTSTEDAGDITNDSELPAGLEMPPMNAPTVGSDLDEIDVGVKNYEQILLSMSAATGVNPADTTIQNMYKEITVQLPGDNNIKSFLPSNQVAITKLAVEFCDKLVESPDLRAVVWPGIDLTQSPTKLFTPTNKPLIINQTITRFLPPMESDAQTQTFTELSKILDELLTGENLTSAATTRKVVKGICISTLASAHSTFL